MLVGVVLPKFLAVIRCDDQQRTPGRLEGAEGLENPRDLGIRVGEHRVVQSAIGCLLLGRQIQPARDEAAEQIHAAFPLDLYHALVAQQPFSEVGVG